MTLRTLSRLKLPLAFVLSLALAGCANWDEIGQEKKVPLPGQRKALFPEGIPGVEFGAPPVQPGNSNIAINRNASPQPEQAQQEAGEQQQQRQPSATQAKQKQPARTAARKKSTDSEDPWMETR